jgi:hypothetical protein
MPRCDGRHPAPRLADLPLRGRRAVPALERGGAAGGRRCDAAGPRAPGVLEPVDGGLAWRRPPPTSHRAVQLSLLAQSTIQTIERYYLAIALLLQAGSGALTAKGWPSAASSWRSASPCSTASTRRSSSTGRCSTTSSIAAARARRTALGRRGRPAAVRRGARARRDRCRVRAVGADPPQHPAGHARLSAAPHTHTPRRALLQRKKRPVALRAQGTDILFRTNGKPI